MQKRVCVVAALLLLLLVGCTGREEKERGYLAADHKFYQVKDYKRAVIALPQCGTIRADRSGSTISTRTAVLALGGAHSAMTAFRRATDLNPKHAGAQPRLAQQRARGGEVEEGGGIAGRRNGPGGRDRSPDNCGHGAYMEVLKQDPEVGLRDGRNA